MFLKFTFANELQECLEKKKNKQSVLICPHKIVVPCICFCKENLGLLTNEL